MNVKFYCWIIMENRIVFKKVSCNSDNGTIRLYGDFMESSFKLSVFQQENAWNSTIIQDALMEFSRHHQLNFEEYYTKLKDYIATTPNGVVFYFDDGEFTVFRIIEKGIKVKYFTHKLQKVEYFKSVGDLLDIFYESNTQTLKRLSELQKENQTNLKSRNESELKLREFIEAKKVEEEMLYSNFVQVLNEKKRRIQHLTEMLDAFNAGRPSLNPQVEANRRKRKKVEDVIVPEVEKKEVISDSESSGHEDSIKDYNTDKEIDDENNGQVDNTKIEEDLSPLDNCKPSTSKTKSVFSFLDDEPSELSLKHNLPKRIRYDEPNIISQSQTLRPQKMAINENINEPKTEDPKPESNNTQGGPAIYFDTQDLLDLI